MKKCIVLLLVMHLLLALSLEGVTYTESVEEYKDYTFGFPSFLQAIDSEAFEGVTAKTIVFLSELQKIESDALQNAFNLKDIHLPDSVSAIADSAFPKNSGLAIHGVEGSYAQQWALENGFDFVVDDIWTDTQITEEIHPENLLSLLWVICPVDTKALISFFDRIKRFIKSMRPQDRPELYPINYRFP